MGHVTAKDLPASAAVYSSFTLRFYDLLVVRFSARFAWRCPSKEIQSLYDRNVGASHLDVGPGTGFYLDHCAFPTPRPAVTLVDINPTSLATAARRVERYSPTAVRADALAPLPLESAFESAAATYLIHCLPGTLAEKAVVFDHLRQHVRPGGKVFGCTILGSGTRHNWFGRRLIAIYNRKGIFGNAKDDLATLDRELGSRFSSYQLRQVGAMALFEAVV